MNDAYMSTMQALLTFCGIWLLAVGGVVAAMDRRRYRVLAQLGAISLIVAALGLGIALAFTP
jgi:hypothetical protein